MLGLGWLVKEGAWEALGGTGRCREQEWYSQGGVVGCRERKGRYKGAMESRLDDDLDLLKCAGTVSDMCYAIKVRRILC